MPSSRSTGEERLDGGCTESTAPQGPTGRWRGVDRTGRPAATQHHSIEERCAGCSQPSRRCARSRRDPRRGPGTWGRAQLLKSRSPRRRCAVKPVDAGDPAVVATCCGSVRGQTVLTPNLTPLLKRRREDGQKLTDATALRAQRRPQPHAAWQARGPEADGLLLACRFTADGCSSPAGDPVICRTDPPQVDARSSHDGR